MRALALWALVASALLVGCTYECNASNCSDGCCGAGGVCLVGGTDQYCGLGGAACQDCSAQKKVCGAGTCEVACDLGAVCATGDDCCSSQICWQQQCALCRLGGESCAHNQDCCGYSPTSPGQRCQQLDLSGFKCK